MKAHKIAWTLLLFGIFCMAAQAQTQKPCSQPEAAQLDFWVGDWDLSWPGGQAGTPEGQQGKGKNSISKILGGCVVHESFAADNGFIGQSHSVYNAQRKTWQQTWVDNQGGYLVFTGGMDDGRMILSTKPFTRNGKTIVSRMVFDNITAENFDWNWQRSTDNGETWQDVWNIRYQRREASESQ